MLSWLLIDTTAMLQPREGTRHWEEEEQLLHRAAGESVRPRRLGLSELPARAD